ncbi:hypothetical protein J2X77_000116 [Sphingobacterium sp. 2149]|nr:hypothetical protein [Sphingobacterium sp. 2149]
MKSIFYANKCNNSGYIGLFWQGIYCIMYEPNTYAEFNYKGFDYGLRQDS